MLNSNISGAAGVLENMRHVKEHAKPSRLSPHLPYVQPLKFTLMSFTSLLTTRHTCLLKECLTELIKGEKFIYSSAGGWMSSRARCCEERGGNETRTRLQSVAQHQEVTEKSSLQTLTASKMRERAQTDADAVWSL